MAEQCATNRILAEALHVVCRTRCGGGGHVMRCTSAAAAISLSRDGDAERCRCVGARQSGCTRLSEACDGCCAWRRERCEARMTGRCDDEIARLRCWRRGCCCLGMASAEVCTTQSQMTAADRDALAAAARDLAAKVQADDVNGSAGGDRGRVCEGLQRHWGCGGHDRRRR